MAKKKATKKKLKRKKKKKKLKKKTYQVSSFPSSLTASYRGTMASLSTDNGMILAPLDVELFDFPFKIKLPLETCFW